MSVVTAATRFNALNYNPKRPNGSCPTVDDVRQDLIVLSKYTDTLRIYSIKDCNQGEPVLRAMEGTSWKLQLGMWVGTDDTAYNADKAELIRLSGVFDLSKNVKALIVGSEASYRKDQTTAQVAAKVREMRGVLSDLKLQSIPISVSETWPFYDQNLIDAVDYINVHVFPFWEGSTIQESNDVLFGHLYDLRNIAKGKKIVVGETGWPTSGDNYGDAVPSLSNSLTFMGQFICRANKENFDYSYFTSFDTPWASTNNASNVESHWGIIEGDYKTPKFQGDDWFSCDSVLRELESQSDLHSSSSSSASSSSLKPTGTSNSSSTGTSTASEKSDDSVSAGSSSSKSSATLSTTLSFQNLLVFLFSLYISCALFI
ncbi:hypothetical protein BB560_003501 [Smittium megazygosporum]|uniref:glucan endo-1,3-beta-D-glucosidase n=1 Tax=Smittium megazygosporum TaxID=133381 RepID=A0A2T9ZBU7_9FUNG|nr:hypothetical protein BB560_003501 [Smittium megazygosporum]